MTGHSVDSRVRFGPFTLDLRSGELHKGATRLKVPDQSIEILKALLERPGDLVTREELQRRLWPSDTFVDFEHGLNAAVRRLRDALGDSADAPTFIETLPRRGYRFIGAVAADPPTAAVADAAARPVPENASSRVAEAEARAGDTTVQSSSASRREAVHRRRRAVVVMLAVAGLLLVSAGAVYVSRARNGIPSSSRPAPTLLTFDPGLQMNPAISPDGTMVAYASNKSGNFDIYIQSTAPGAEARPVTRDPAHEWQPAWSRDGRIAFRSERDGGGLYVVPATGGTATKICDFGYDPRWSPDGTRLLFSELLLNGAGRGDVYTIAPDESPARPRRIDLTALSGDEQTNPSIGWDPNGRRVTFFSSALDNPQRRIPRFVTIDIQDGRSIRSAVEPRVQEAFDQQPVSHLPGGQPLVWAPDGRAIYFVGSSRGLQNVWSVDVDPHTLSITGGPHRLTTMTEHNEGVSLSGDGSRLVFGAANRKTRMAVYDLDASGRQIAGAARIVTEEAVRALMPDLSRDGLKLLVLIQRPGSGTELTDFRLHHLNGAAPDSVLIMNNGRAGEGRLRPRWSPNGRTIVYTHIRRVADAAGGEQKVVRSLRLLDVATGLESDLTTPIPPSAVAEVAYGWSKDGQSVIAVSDRRTAGAQAVLLIPVGATPAAERNMKVVARSDEYFMWNTGMSPVDERWICFQTTDAKQLGGKSRLGVMNSKDGIPKWLPSGEAWVDKPRWSTDGRLIYYISRQGGPFNIWALGFEPATGSPVGKPIQLTHFDGPGEQIPPDMTVVELGVAAGRLAVPIIKPTGGIWMLENVNR